jgi:hypothetical protein
MSLSSTLTAEARIARGALRVALGEEQQSRLEERIRAAGGEIRAERFAEWCRFHGIAPSVYEVLASLSTTPPTERLQSALAPVRREAAGAGLVQADALARILRRFDRAGIDVIPLKGISLAVRDYGGVGRRKDGDHDLLVRPDQIGEAGRILADMGYHSPNAPQPISTWTEETTPEDLEGKTTYHAHKAVKTEGPMSTVVELHWAGTERNSHQDPEIAPLLARRMWERSTEGELLGAPVRQLAPEDEILFLSFHLVRHLSSHRTTYALRLAMLEDLARRIRAEEIDWSVLDRRIEAARPVFRILGPIRFLWTEGLGARAGTLLPDGPLDVSPWPPWNVPFPSPARLLSDHRPVPSKPTATGHRQRLDRLIVRLLLLRRPADRWRLLRDELAVRDHDRARAPTSVPDAALLPFRLARIAWRLLWGDRSG